MLEVQLLVGEQRREIFEPRPRLGLLRIEPVDRVDLEHRRILLVASGRPAEARDVITLAQPELPRQLHGDVGIVSAGQVAVDAEEAVALVAQVEIAGNVDGFHPDLRRVVVLAFRSVGPVLAVGAVEPLLVSALHPITASLVATPATAAAVTALALAILTIALVTIVALRRRRRAV